MKPLSRQWQRIMYMDYSGFYYIIIVVFHLGLGSIDIITLLKLRVYHIHTVLTSDVRKGLKVDLSFDLAQPFKPFEQLMGVLPSRSRKLLPEAYRVYHLVAYLMVGFDD